MTMMIGIAVAAAAPTALEALGVAVPLVAAEHAAASDSLVGLRYPSSVDGRNLPVLDTYLRIQWGEIFPIRRQAG